MQVDISKMPIKYILGVVLFFLIPIICMIVFFSVFASGTAHGVPRAFAVDNEHRLYLSFGSGVYVVDDGQFQFLWPSIQYGFALSVSEDDQLALADASTTRVIDLNKSNLASTQLEIVDRYPTPDDVKINSGENWKVDQQNGVTYRFQGNSVYYQIIREGADGSPVFFAMPRSDRIWHGAATVCFFLFFFYVVAGLIVIYRYAAKHPEIKQRVVYPWQKRKKR